MSEEVQVSNLDCQKLGLIKVIGTGELVQTVVDHPGSFTSMINNLAATIPLENKDPGHECPEMVDGVICANQTEDNQYDQNTTPEQELR